MHIYERSEIRVRPDNDVNVKFAPIRIHSRGEIKRNARNETLNLMRGASYKGVRCERT